MNEPNYNDTVTAAHDWLNDSGRTWRSDDKSVKLVSDLTLVAERQHRQIAEYARMQAAIWPLLRQAVVSLSGKLVPLTEPEYCAARIEEAFRAATGRNLDGSSVVSDD